MKHARLAIVGWYHKLNYGDDLLQLALTHLFSDCSLSFIGIEAVTPELLNGFDHVVFGGGSLYPNKFLDDPAFLGTMRVPVSLLGVSSRGVTNHAVLRQLLDRCTVAVVRDRATIEVFDHPRVVLAPDLAWLIPLAEGSPLREGIGVNLRRWPKLEWQPEPLVEALRRASGSGAVLRGLPLYVGHQTWESGRAVSDRTYMQGLPGLDTVDIEPSSQAYGTFRLVVAMRFHALVLALQAATPCIGFSYHPKIRALMAEADLGEFCVDLDAPAALERAVVSALTRESELRERLRVHRAQRIEQAQVAYGHAREQILRRLGVGGAYRPGSRWTSVARRLPWR